MNSKNWQLRYDDLQTGKKSYGQESLLSLGNGFLGWRGAPIWSTYSDNHYPGLYAAGIFNQTSTPVAGRDVINEDMVNLPNPQLLEVTVNGTALANLDLVKRSSKLNFKSGILEEIFVFQHDQGLVTLTSAKFIDPINWHMLAINASVTADFDAEIQLSSIVDTTVETQNVERYRAFESHQFDVQEVNPSTKTVLVETKQSGIQIGLAVDTQVEYAGVSLPVIAKVVDQKFVEEVLVKTLANTPVQLAKRVAIATSRETFADLVPFLQNEITQHSLVSIQNNMADYWAEIWADKDIIVDTESQGVKDFITKQWNQLWDNDDVTIASDGDILQLMIRMNVFHLNQAAQWRANEHLDASVGSRGLTGEGYRGHIFWDELFVLPYYAANEPRTARAILQYRIKRLSAAQANASHEGEAGAMYPWQAGLYGDEQSQVIHLNTVNNEWEPDNSRLQRHVSLAIVYDLWIYTQFTGDTSLLDEGGLNVLLETSKFWLNKVQKADDGRFDLSGVMGPDEYHEAYPEAKEGGVKNNAYTNVMLSWSLGWLLDLQKTLPSFAAIAAADNFDADLLQKAAAVAANLRLEQRSDGVFAQYQDYFNLSEIDFDAYAKKYGDIHRIDRLLKAEGKSPDDYQVAKQADFLMLMYNLGNQRVAHLLEQMGYQLPADWLVKNTDYYQARTVHGSTTSRPVFAGIDVHLNRMDEAEEFLQQAIRSDYDDIQGGTTAEGVHAGVMGETLAVIQNEFGGVDLRDGQFSINPHLPENWSHLAFTQVFQGVKVAIVETPTVVQLTANADLDVEVMGQPAHLVANQSMTFKMEK
ncbi:glycosyl hydrolase family 65 protein [Convivina praedatoris]|uniref:Trehalose 6-phosphate phosphorylase n=1 Tax=Convivina praedatoris TaxID=2880963 RepID=A0ABM9D0R0_9LACO|nr:glycosyl hydrolase family 65 protein [Convivina sp. LMG 32447]CAH1852050.1 Trehalose 6-phosphate phosphorylase [Convivina sp. LMG 32447]CAH1852075.1 Trehalose 6-phosphate phosphorylase [Convivina sp. LMG 32447]CAH1852855.1 Trehalose 6-phosphate phosphorylase [Convivina sp. LMG 32447]